MKKYIVLLCVFSLYMLNSCRNIPTATPFSTEEYQTELHKIDRYPPENPWHQGKLSWLPGLSLDTENPMVMDIRSADLSSLDLKDDWDALRYATFDSNTIWPVEDQMPPEFDPALFIEIGKNPGLGIRDLHAQGITGKGVSIAIIDQSLLLEHVEYSGRILRYEELNVLPDSASSPHGPAATSLAVGQSIGTAPQADIYYFASNVVDPSSTSSEAVRNFYYTAHAVRRVIEINRLLPEDHKIRAISLSLGWNPDEIGYDDITDAVEEANNEGIFVVSGRMYLTYDYRLYWLGRFPYDDPDSFDSYGLCVLCADVFPDDPAINDSILIPMDSRTVASYTGVDDYAFFSIGGGSWTMPYFAGVYALAVQVDPLITPYHFLELVIETGRPFEIEKSGDTFFIGTIIDPVALIDALRY